jgi:hypothetical protein
MKAPHGQVLDETPIIHVSDISARKYVGLAETPEGELYIEKITAHGVDYLVAGGACNVGMLPSYAMEIEFSTEETLQELVSDVEELESGGSPSGALLAWHGSLCI